MQLFEKVEVDKPQASRSTSAEIYVIGLKYKAPAKIDPRLLDVKHLFQGGKEPPKVIWYLSELILPFFLGIKKLLYMIICSGVLLIFVPDTQCMWY